MGRAPCCSKVGLHKGPWTAEEDALLIEYIRCHGEGNWRSLPQRADLLRCGKGCRLRWMNYLRPGIKRGKIEPDEEDLIIRLHSLLGNRWSLIAARLPGRTDNEIKNYWNSRVSKRLRKQGFYSREDHLADHRKRAEHHTTKESHDEKKDGAAALEGAATSSIKIYTPKPPRIKPAMTICNSDSIMMLTDPTMGGPSCKGNLDAGMEDSNICWSIMNETGDPFARAAMDHAFACDLVSEDDEHFSRLYQEYSLLLNSAEQNEA